MKSRRNIPFCICNRWLVIVRMKFLCWPKMVELVVFIVASSRNFIVKMFIDGLIVELTWKLCIWNIPWTQRLVFVNLWNAAIFVDNSIVWSRSEFVVNVFSSVYSKLSKLCVGLYRRNRKQIIKTSPVKITIIVMITRVEIICFWSASVLSHFWITNTLSFGGSIITQTTASRITSV